MFIGLCVKKHLHSASSIGGRVGTITKGDAGKEGRGKVRKRRTGEGRGKGEKGKGVRREGDESEDVLKVKYAHNPNIQPKS